MGMASSARRPTLSDYKQIWRSGEVLAFTERDGPGRPPAATSTWMMCTLVGVVGVTFVGMMTTDTLCPDHRAWVEGLAMTGLVTILVAVVGLLRGWASAPVLTLLASSLGVAIGLIDTVHDATRGRLIALGFAVGCALAAASTMRVMRLRAWDRATVAGLKPVAHIDDVVVPEPRDALMASPVHDASVRRTPVDT
jgi:hypothetical protein